MPVKQKYRRPFGSAAGGSPSPHRPGPLRRRHFISRSMAHARGAFAGRARQYKIDRRQRGACAARRARGVDACRRRAHSADPVSSHRPQDTRALPTAGAGERRRALCRRAGRGGLCRQCLCRGRRRRAGRAFNRAPAGNDARDRATGRLCWRAVDRSQDILQKAYGDVDAAFRNAHAVVSLELSIGRHSGVPMETRGAIARYDAARDILELHGAAKVPHWNRDAIAQMLGRAKRIRSALRRPCRRRLRHSRRNLS